MTAKETPMDNVVRYVVRLHGETVTLCETREQAEWMAFMLGRGAWFGIVTERRLLAWIQAQERKATAKRDTGTEPSES